MATTPNVDTGAAAQLLSELNDQMQSFTFGDAKARQKAVSAARSLANALETPSEWMVRSTWAEPSHLTVLRTATDVHLFDHLATGDGAPKSSQQLAEACKVEQGLAEKMLRMLAAMGTIREVDVDRYAPTPVAKALTTEIFQSSVKFMYPYVIATNNAAPDFFAKNEYKLPTSSLDTIMQHQHGGKGETHVMQHFVQNNLTQGFAHMMETWNLDRPHWSDEGFYPVKERLIEGANGDDDSVFMVDVGGSQGHDLAKFLARHPYDAFPGHLVVQDTPDTINGIPEGKLERGVKAMVHDFLKPQPIQGARLYFLHSIIHDNEDDRARVILKQLAGAMKKGYSKLIVWDQVLPAKGAPAIPAALDWEMMTFFAASERTETQWKALLEDPEVGLKVNGVWEYSQYDQMVIEAELV